MTPVNNEIVWVTGSSSLYTVYRADPSGANAQPITSFSFPSDGASWYFVNLGRPVGLVRPDRIFYRRNDPASHSSSLYYISTKVVNAAGVLVYTAADRELAGGPQSVLANKTVVLASAYRPLAGVYEVYSAPLPNGILSGEPPQFVAGRIYGGVVDETNFYGSFLNSSVPSDAIVKCSVSSCGSPTVIARGQADSSAFTDDATAIYWTTPGAPQQNGFFIWKTAK